jgi:hypothetical protein
MTTLRGMAQPSDCLLTHMLPAYRRKLLVIWDSYLFRERLVTFEDRLREERDLDVSLGELARSSSGTVQHEKGSL